MINANGVMVIRIEKEGGKTKMEGGRRDYNRWQECIREQGGGTRHIVFSEWRYVTPIG